MLNNEEIIVFCRKILKKKRYIGWLIAAVKNAKIILPIKGETTKKVANSTKLNNP
jgi:hypothetical protein